MVKEQHCAAHSFKQTTYNDQQREIRLQNQMLQCYSADKENNSDPEPWHTEKRRKGKEVCSSYAD